MYITVTKNKLQQYRYHLFHITNGYSYQITTDFFQIQDINIGFNQPTIKKIKKQHSSNIHTVQIQLKSFTTNPSFPRQSKRCMAENIGWYFRSAQINF